MNRKNTKNALFMSVISLLLCFSMLLGTTFAWFTDEVTSGGNVITAGTLKIDLLHLVEGDWVSLKENPDHKVFNYDLWEPGYTQVETLKIANLGNLAFQYQMNVTAEEGTPVLGPKGENLADVIDVYMCFGEANAASFDDIANGTSWWKMGTLAELMASPEGVTQGKMLPAGATYEGELLGQNGVMIGECTASIALHMQETAGNEYQGLSVGDLYINLAATQYTYENDSFDDQYDKNATFDDLANTSILATETKTLADGAASVKFDLNHSGMTIAKVTVPASAIEDPAQPVTVTFDGINPSEAAIVDENTRAYAFDINVTNLKENLTDDQLITVVVTAPNALAAMKAYHNGELIENAVYDEVEGTITFKTASFSPYDFTYTEMSAGTLAELRDAVNASNVEIKLTNDLTIDLTAGSADRSEDHVLVSGKDTYHNAVNIIGKNVAINLNGHKITVKCSDAYNGNQDVGALFFVDKEGSLNIIDRVGTGFIKMASSIYMVWAPYDAPSYMDIYSGAFIADSYAGDPIGTPVDSNGNYDPANGNMKNENSNRALVYAGTGGNMNIYGGYFLYNNTPNDSLDRNNGAFNCTNWYEGDDPFITIHDGVMLINKEYRQNPANTSTPNGSFDDFSIKLAKDCEVAEVSKSVMIDGETYTTWYEVVADITSITASVKKGVYDADYTFTVDDFNVYAFTTNGTSGKITNFDVSVDKATGIATITYTSNSGKDLQTTCSISQMNLKLLDENRIRLPIKDPNSDITAPFFGTGNFSVSGWAWLINGAYTYDYFANNNLTYTAPNGETVTGFNNKYGDWGNTYWNGFVEGEYSDGYYGLTINNAKPYTTLGINCVVGCLQDAPQLKGFGAYINDDLSTLQWAAPAVVYTEGDMYNHYGWNNGHSVLEINCADMKPGESYDVHWVLVFEDGVTPLADWKVNMAEASASDAVFTETEKPNANVIIMSGQSNMFGPAPLTEKVINDYKNADYSNVFIKYSNINFDVAPDGTILGTLSTIFSNSEFQRYRVGIGAQGTDYFGPELALAYQLATDPTTKDQQWFIVKYAAAGTALSSQWTSNCVLDGKTTTLTNDMLDYVQDAIDEISKDYDVHIRSFMWMQGESDASTAATANNYANLEKTLVSRVRETFAAYATRPVGSVAGSGISFIDAGIALNDTDFGQSEALHGPNGEIGPNDWIWAENVNAGKVNNAQQWCSLPAMSSPNYTPTVGPLTGIQFQPGAPSQMNPAGGSIVNSIFIDTHHLISKATANSLDPSHELYENYGNAGDNTDWAHYSANSMQALGELFGSCLQYMIMQNG